MRIIRFLAADGDVLIGEEMGEGKASPLLDPRGLLDPMLRATPADLLPGKHALVADDDTNIREMVKAVLQKSGCTCTLCSDGAETLKAIQQQKYDFIISDIMMPHHDGYEIFAAARQRDADTPVLLITGFGYDPTHTLVRTNREGHESVLYKPFTPRQLLGALTRAMGAVSGSSTCIGGMIRSKQEVKIDRLLAPCAPGTLLCLGGNAPDPTRDGEREVGDLELFMKPPSAVIGTREKIPTPSFSNGLNIKLDGEGELAVIIGQEMNRVPESDVRKHIYGYTAANDMTARCFQSVSGPGAWMRGKGFDGFCPLGPAIIPDEAIDDPNHLVVQTHVNGVEVRGASLDDMGRSLESSLSAISGRITLHPGTVILMGAPPRLSTDGDSSFLRAGDEIAIKIDKIGALTNTIGNGSNA